MRALVLPALFLAAAPLAAQIPSGLGGLLGGALPDTSKVGAGNAAGVLGYCVKNNYLSASGASKVLGALTGQKGVTDTPGYTAGQSGILQAGGSNLSLANVKDQVKTKVCDMVLKRGGSLLGR